MERDSLSNTKTDPSGHGRPDDEKTIEELLADLGPSEQWDVSKSEEDNVNELLQSAKAALSQDPGLEQVPGDADDERPDSKAQQPIAARFPSIDVTVFQQEPASEDENEEPNAADAKSRGPVDKEADDILQRLMDEVKYEQSQLKHERHSGSDSERGEDEGNVGYSHAGDTKPNRSGLDLPSAPVKDFEGQHDGSAAQTETAGDEDLAARFASLSLPSPPTSIRPNSARNKANKSTGFADEEIDTWCIICNDNATLQCLGCDNDLYCTNCWMEGHRGEDAGFEERTHKAVQFVKGGGKKKQRSRQTRVMMGT